MANQELEKFPLVGVGASAGGLDSFKKFLKAIPENSGMAYILVQHLSPSHDSKLSEILSRATSIPVTEITDDCRIEANHIYVIPENRLLEVTDHTLKLTPRKGGTSNMPIDLFFSSLAKVHGTLAVGVILSGTATDGTLGLRDIKEYGGVTFAEDPVSAAWDGMPKNAIAAGVVDFVLPVGEIPLKLIKVHTLYGPGATGENGQQPKVDANGLKKILSIVQQNSGVDFSYYKEPTVLRRIERRMAINQIGDYPDYISFLDKNSIEQQSLYQDLLIKVTSFFRDPEVFEELDKTVFPSLLEDKDGPIRIWVAACASGEEAYSMTIALFDAMGGLEAARGPQGKSIQLFATDISEAAITKARIGIYSASEVQPLSQRQLDAYFIKTNGNYKVVKAVRDTIVFAKHNFLQDPPFSKIDLVSCRNVLIYLDSFLQKKALTTFHYALKENGFLVLGKSETPGTPSDHFVPLSKKEKIYSRKAGPGRFEHIAYRKNKSDQPPTSKPVVSSRKIRTDFRKNAESVLISSYTPASVIVDDHMEVVHINGSVVPFLEPSAGKPTHELMKMARKELAFELRNALQKVKESQETVIKEGIPLKHNGEQFSVTIEIVPLIDTLKPYYLIIFQKSAPDTSFFERIFGNLNPPFWSSGNNHLQKSNAALEQELEQAREDMRQISDEQQSYSEQLQSANEELLSSNEEMQSLNEELETSKEEVQATNEELIITNRELMDKREEQGHTLNLMKAIMSTLREPFVLLEKNMQIQLTNAAYCKKFDVDESETEGKSFFELHDGLWNNIELRAMLQNVLPRKERMVDQEIAIKSTATTKHSFMFNAREISRDKELDKLILLSMEDITEKKKTQGYVDTIAELKKTNDQLDQYVHVASHDLQEPLRKIMIFSDLLIEEGETLTTAGMENLKKIASSTERMSGLIKGLLDYSRVANHRDLFQPTDLNEISKEILADFELLIEEKQAQIHIGKLPVLEAIPIQINQLLTNLIGNALKFTNEGVPPIIDVSSRPFPEEEIKKHASLKAGTLYHEITIKDNGIGFDQKYGEQIFIIFQRLRKSAAHVGTGIGLSLVKKIVENHHGAVEAVSGEDDGAKFHLILPLEQPEKE